MVYTGAFAYIQWQKESTYATAAADINTAGEPFGFEQKLGSLSFTNNKIPLSQLNSVEVKTFAYGQTQGSFSLDFVMSNPWFFELIGFKDGSTAACTPGAGQYQHTWAIDSTTATFIPQSYTVALGIDGSSSDMVRTLAGSLTSSATISTSVGEVVRVSLDNTYQNEAFTTTLDCSPTGAESVSEHIPFTFAHGSLQFNCTTLAEVQDVSLTFASNSEHLWGIGQSTAVSSFKRLFEITGTFKFSFTETEGLGRLKDVYAQSQDTKGNAAAVCYASEQTQIILTFDNGVSGVGNRKITLTLTGIAIDSHTINVEPNEPIFVDIPFQARTASVVAINEIASIPPAS